MEIQGRVCACKIAKNGFEDYSYIEKVKSDKILYYNKENQLHRLIGPAIEWYDGEKYYYINNIFYMSVHPIDSINKLYLVSDILKLLPKYEIYIKQNIDRIIKENNLELELAQDFNTEQYNKLPDWLKAYIK